MAVAEIIIILVGVYGHATLTDPLILAFNTFTVFMFIICAVGFLSTENVIQSTTRELGDIKSPRFNALFYASVTSNALVSVLMFSIGEWLVGFAWVCVVVYKVIMCNEVKKRLGV